MRWCGLVCLAVSSCFMMVILMVEFQPENGDSMDVFMLVGGDFDGNDPLKNENFRTLK